MPLTDRNNAPLVPGALYCTVVIRTDGETGQDYESFDGLYWYASDGDFYAYNGILHEDDIEPSHPEFDFLVRQEGLFEPGWTDTPPEEPNDCPECARAYGPNYTGACAHG